MNLLGIDFETNGLDPKKDRIIEIGAVLWASEYSLPIQILSVLVKQDCALTPEITELTGITDVMLREYGVSEVEAFSQLEKLADKADYLVAHNGTTFDRLFFDEALKRSGYESWDFHWIDTKTDVQFPPAIDTRRLKFLAAEHGFLNPFAHRAVFDVLTMLKVLDRYDIDDVIRRSKEPTVFVRACVSFDEKEKAKTRGYNWSGSQKIWWRAFKESDYLADKLVCGFQTVLLEKSPE